jgi:hypothetical protein
MERGSPTAWPRSLSLSTNPPYLATVATGGAGAAGAGATTADPAGTAAGAAGVAGPGDADGDAAGATTGATTGAVWAGAATGAVDDPLDPDEPDVIGVMVTPVTSPEIDAFWFFPRVPRASRVAFAFAFAAARAAAERGLAGFLGVIMNSARMVVWLLNMVSMTLRRARTVAPSCRSTFCSAIWASFQPDFAAAVVDTALSTPWTKVTACVAVRVWPAIVNVELAQFFGMPVTSAWHSAMVRVRGPLIRVVVLVAMGTTSRKEW